MRASIAWSAAAGVAASASLAVAAGVGLVATPVGTGETTVAPCDTNGFAPSFATSRGNVTAVTVSAIADPECEGGMISVTVTNSAGDSIATGGPQTVPTDGDNADNSVTVTTSPQPGAGQVAGYHVSITGP